MLKGGGGTTNYIQQRFCKVFTWQLEVLAILKGGAKSFHSFKGGVRTILPCPEGAGATSF